MFIENFHLDLNFVAGGLQVVPDNLLIDPTPEASNIHVYTGCSIFTATFDTNKEKR